MLIRVKYKDGKFDMVGQKMLNYLIEEDKVTGFMRSTGWVSVGRDPIRRGGAERYWAE